MFFFFFVPTACCASNQYWSLLVESNTITRESHLVPNSTFTIDLKHVRIRSRVRFCIVLLQKTPLNVASSLNFILWHASSSFRNRIWAVIGKRFAYRSQEEKKYKCTNRPKIAPTREACRFRVSLEEMRGHIERDKVRMYALILCSGKQDTKRSTGIMSALIPNRLPHVLSTKWAFSMGVCGQKPPNCSQAGGFSTYKGLVFTKSHISEYL